MIRPKNNRVIFWFFRRYVKWLVGKQFDRLLFNTVEIDTNRSILLIANHYSFWDALVLFCVNDCLFQKKFHGMILEETSRREPFLKYAGAFSVNKNTKDILLSLDYAAKLLNDPNNLVLIFPQGQLYPNFTTHIHFEKGVQRIINQAQGKFQLVFAAAFIQYFKHIKPTATVYLKTESVIYAGKSITELQRAYQQHFNASKQLQTEIDVEQ
jgi:1-acyl-sn-glycerol-3-phosphate acyltransferase